MTVATAERTDTIERAHASERPTREPLDRLLRNLRTGPDGLGEREAARRLGVDGPNVLPRPRQQSWLIDLARQFTHPLACCCGGRPRWPWSREPPFCAGRSSA